MRSSLTIITLALLLGLALELRRRWPRFTRRTQLRWLVCVCGLLLVKLAADAIRWETTFSRLNDLLVWARLAGYLLLVILFTRLRPRALTVPIALVLLLPIASATLFLPLEALFDPAPRRLTALGSRVFFEQVAWTQHGGDNLGTDYTLARHARMLPFLQHDLHAERLYRTQCDTSAISAHLDPAAREIVVLCPSGAPGQPALEEQVLLR